jgi:lysozyme
MKMSTEGLIALIGHEGIVLSRYLDSVKVWTIGIGHTKAAGGLDPEKFTGTLTMAQALDLLRDDIVKYENGVNNAIKVPLKQHEFDALVSFHYNTGAISRATLTKTLNSGNKKAAGEQFMNWVKPAAIHGRRKAEARLFLLGEYPPPVATAYPADAAGNVLWSKGTRVNVEHLLATPRPTVPRPPPVPIDAPPAPEPEGGWLSALLSVIAKAFNRSAT